MTTTTTKAAAAADELPPQQVAEWPKNGATDEEGD
jgi:hypothetical protein